MPIVALTKNVKDPKTKATAAHHVLSVYLVELGAKKTQATLKSFAEAGAEQSITTLNVVLQQAPPAGVDTLQWLYQRLIDDPAPSNVLHGAVPVLATEEAAP